MNGGRVRHFATASPADTAEFGRRLGERLSPGDAVLLTGGLGAGKSVLARGIARGLGIDRPMPSPTFALMRRYEGRVALHHFDLYRLDAAGELYAAGLDEFMPGDGIAVVEWADRCELPLDRWIRLDIEGDVGGSSRTIAAVFFGMDREECAADALSGWAVHDDLVD